MTAALLALLGTLASIAFLWIKRRWRDNDDPQLRREAARQENSAIIAGAGAGMADLNRIVDAAVHRVPDAAGSAPVGSADRIPAERLNPPGN